VKRRILPGIPFVLSLGLSLSTAGSHVYWQDSGFYLVAVKELGVLYPPGFALYVLLCKAWTLALWFVDFTYAVHLFSAVCAALAAGTIAVAARDLLRTKGPLFHNAEEQGPLAEWVGAAIGCLAASGYTFWAAAILAKVYAFYYLILCLLIWRMIRADESGKPRDFTWVAVLIGLAWQAHPSATNAGLALVLFVAFHRRAVGWRGIVWRTSLAAACAIGPIHLLPIMARQGSVIRFGDPETWDGFWSYVLGSRFTGMKGVFGLDASRVASVFRYGWEEFLGVGLLLVPAGVWRLWKENRRLLLGVAAWVVPVFIVTVLFKIEGQHDFWMLAAWIPLWLLAAVGLSFVGKVRELALILALVGTVWAVVANRKDLDQRHYTLAETFGLYFLGPQESVVYLSSDDSQSTAVYLQRIRSLGSKTTLVGASQYSDSPIIAALEPAIFWESGEPPHEVPWGGLFRHSELPSPAADDPKAWKEPAAPEDVISAFRRERGQYVEFRTDGIRVRPEPYEKRLLRLILLIRRNHALVLARSGRLAEAQRLYESILTLDPSMRENGDLLMTVAVVEVGLQKASRAEELFKSALTKDLEPGKRAEAYYFLAALCGGRPEGAEWKAKALASPDLAPILRAKLEGR
jgi:hypothetical protein